MPLSSLTISQATTRTSVPMGIIRAALEDIIQETTTDGATPMATIRATTTDGTPTRMAAATILETLATGDTVDSEVSDEGN